MVSAASIVADFTPGSGQSLRVPRRADVAPDYLSGDLLGRLSMGTWDVCIVCMMCMYVCVYIYIHNNV